LNNKFTGLEATSKVARREGSYEEYRLETKCTSERSTMKRKKSRGPKRARLSITPG